MSEEIDTYEEYYDNGQLRKKATRKDGKLDGPFEEYYGSGRLRTKGTFKNGNLDTYEDYYENGQLLTKCTYKNGKLDGPYEDYYENGQLLAKCTYKDGELDGPYEEYYENGQLRMKCTYKDGWKDGPYEDYREDGQLGKKCTYKDDKLDGPYEGYHFGKCIKTFYKDGEEVTEEEYNRLTQTETVQIVEVQTDKKATSEVISDKTDENSCPRKSRAEKRASLMELQESARFVAKELSMTSDTRHALAVALNNLRHEFGCAAKKVAIHSKTVKALREKEANQR